MKDITKYQGVIPAFYACYDAEGNISTEGVKALTRHLIAKGVKGVYVGGSSGECIYQHVDERKAVLEAVMSEAKGKLTVIAHVGCNNTADSVELARHAESVGVDAIASIPPIYFHLPEYAIAKYWNDTYLLWIKTISRSINLDALKTLKQRLLELADKEYSMARVLDAYFVL